MTGKRYTDNPFLPTSNTLPKSGIVDYVHFIYKTPTGKTYNEFYTPSNKLKTTLEKDLIKELLTLKAPYKGALNVYLYIISKLSKDRFKVSLCRSTMKNDINLGTNALDNAIVKLIELDVIARSKKSKWEFHVNPHMIYNGSEYISHYMNINPDSVNCAYTKVFK